jgi:hypothetical protein
LLGASIPPATSFPTALFLLPARLYHCVNICSGLHFVTVCMRLTSLYICGDAVVFIARDIAGQPLPKKSILGRDHPVPSTPRPVLRVQPAAASWIVRQRIRTYTRCRSSTRRCSWVVPCGRFIQSVHHRGDVDSTNLPSSTAVVDARSPVVARGVRYRTAM